MKIHELNPLSSPEWVDLILQFCARQGVDRAGFFRYDAAAGLVQGVIGIDPEGKPENLSALLYGATVEPDCPLQNVAQEFVPYHLTNDSAKDHPEWAVPPMNFGFAVVPVEHGGTIIGVIAVDNWLSKRRLRRDRIPRLIEGARSVAPHLAGVEVTTAADLMPAGVDALDEGVCLVGTGGWILYCNRALAEMYGMTPEQVRKVPYQTLSLSLGEDGSALAPAGEACDGVDDTDRETMNKRADGELFPVRLRVLPLFDQTKPSCRMVVAQDLTQQRELERARRHEAELQGALKVIRTYNHEINNALQGLMGSIELLDLSLAEKTDSVTRYFTNINVCVEEIKECIRAMRNHTRG